MILAGGIGRTKTALASSVMRGDRYAPFAIKGVEIAPLLEPDKGRPPR
jgi:hypothetical protein